MNTSQKASTAQDARPDSIFLPLKGFPENLFYIRLPLGSIHTFVAVEIDVEVLGFTDVTYTPVVGHGDPANTCSRGPHLPN
jgi:hypothetical protein